MSRVEVLDHRSNDQLLELVERCPVQVRLGFGMPGTSLVRLERSPDYFAFLHSFGGTSQTMGVFRNGRLVATGSVVKRRVLWDGRPCLAEFVCDVRTDPEFRGATATYRVLRAIVDRPERAERAYTCVVQGNRPARGFATGRLGLRAYRKQDDLLHLCFYTGAPLPGPGGGRFEVVESEQDGHWESLFQRWAGRRNLAPVAPLPRVPGERRFVILKRRRPVAVGSQIDQSAFRRVRVLHLCTRDRWVRRFTGLLADLASLPRLPGQGEVFPRAYLANLAWDENEEEAVAALLRVASRLLRGEGVPLLYLGVARKDPLVRHLPVRWSIQRTMSGLFLKGFPESASSAGVFFNLNEL